MVDIGKQSNIGLESGQTWLFIGDSITDCDKGMWFAPYGTGYVRDVQRQLKQDYPTLKPKVINKGISGNTIRDLAKRWEHDVIQHDPAWLFIFVGVNDVWRMIDNQFDEAVPLGEFEATYRALLTTTTNKLSAKITLIAPFLVSPNKHDLFRLRLDEYGAVIAQLAQEWEVNFIPLQAIFDEALQQHSSSHWSIDGVHPHRSSAHCRPNFSDILSISTTA